MTVNSFWKDKSKKLQATVISLLLLLHNHSHVAATVNSEMVAAEQA